MGSVGAQQPIMGEFVHPVITPETKNSDPATRNYYAPPNLGRLVPRKYPLIDIRPLLEDPDYSPMALLQSHGFGVVKNHSAFIDKLNNEDVDQDLVADVYLPEIKDLVLKTTGAKWCFFSVSSLRQGKRAPEPFVIPDARAKLEDAKGTDGDTKPKHKLAGQSSRSRLSLGAPIRIPHNDYTPLGARQHIRFEEREILEAAEASGVIAHEDRICKDIPLSATDKDAEALIAEKYNEGGSLGPRYAAYSIWRPLRTVGRDPIALASRKEVPRADGELVHWPYLNRIPGAADIKGDYLKEFAMLGVKAEQPPAPVDADAGSLKWYYISKQEPDEVLFIKLFDSAALGELSTHAGAPWHASPEIGDAAGSDQPRESVDIRVLVFW